MALTIGDNFSYLGAKPLDGRIKYNTISAMVAMTADTLYDGIMAYCVEDGKEYQWKSTNDVDQTLGKWREFASGGGASALDDLTDVDITSATDGQVLEYNNTSGKWVNANKPSIPSAYTSTPEMDGVGAAGSSTAFAKGDHVHPSDTNKADVSTVNGILDGTTLDSFGDVETALADKADKVSSATNGNFAGLDANGNLTDSGVKAVNISKSLLTASAEIDTIGWKRIARFANATFTFGGNVFVELAREYNGAPNEGCVFVVSATYNASASCTLINRKVSGDVSQNCLLTKARVCDGYLEVYYTSTTKNYVVANMYVSNVRSNGITAEQFTDSTSSDGSGIIWDLTNGSIEVAKKPDVSSKADKVSSPTAGDFAALDSNGNLTDSGKAPSDLTGITTIAPAFDSTATYNIGDRCTYNGAFSKVTAAHTGAWDAQDVTEITVNDAILSNTIGIGGGYAPVGTTSLILGSTAPQDYLECDGSVYNIAAYPQLAAYIESQFGSKNYFGGDGTTTFAVPTITSSITGTIYCIKAICAGEVYSTTEREDGTWIDGSIIYKKTINFGALPNATSKNVAHGISNLDNVISIEGFMTNGSISASSNNWVTNVPGITGVSQSDFYKYGVACYVQGANVTIQTGMDRSSMNAYITLRYTKTT